MEKECFNWEDKKILIAEDDEINFFLTKRYIQKTGIQIHWAKNGQEAIDFCNNGKSADLILMDLKMPVIDGYEATKRIREANNDVPIIAHTAHLILIEDNNSKIDQWDDVLIKPVDPHLLLQTINRYLF